ncbi:MAG: hypothetical protein C0486_00640 [Erythrobacter sp.]|nr:hypothetical protein [Erythrobacter sp.]MBA4082587.1 hypothetical protein [Erythrobacter sp.]
MSDWLELFNAYRAPAQHIASLLLAAAGWRWGGGPERWMTAAFVLTMIMPLYLIRLAGGDTLAEYQWAYVTLDLIAAAIFTAVAVNANRNYPLWVAGFQLVAVGAHMVGALVPAVSPLALAILIIGPSYCQLLVLFAGFVRHVRRERQFGPYRAWRTSPSPIGGLTA